MRLFTAIELPQHASPALIALIDHLRPLAKLAWTPPEKLHITTKFIGEYPQPRLSDLVQALSSVAVSHPIDITILRLGWLPSPRFPLTLFAAVERTESLHALATATDRALQPLGIAPEQRIYRPHVTLARMRSRRREPLPELHAEIAKLALLDFASFQAPSFHCRSKVESS
ncbi:MAG: RNA 2',3'-cyclic phosphodiesterase [Acidobacteriota bacterium]